MAGSYEIESQLEPDIVRITSVLSLGFMRSLGDWLVPVVHIPAQLT